MSEIGLWVGRIVAILFIGLFIAIIFKLSKNHDEDDRKKYKDADKPYLLQKTTNPDPFSNSVSGSTPRWQVWLNWFLLPIIFGLVFYFTK